MEKKNIDQITLANDEAAKIHSIEENELPSILADSGLVIGIDLANAEAVESILNESFAFPDTLGLCLNEPLDAERICVGTINAGLITTKVSELLERAGIIRQKLLVTEERSKNKLYKVNVSRMAKTTGDMVQELMACIIDLDKQALHL